MYACFILVDPLSCPSHIGLLGGCAPNGGHQWQNPPRCDYWVLVGSPEPQKIGFWNLVAVAYGPVSKKVAVNPNNGDLHNFCANNISFVKFFLWPNFTLPHGLAESTSVYKRRGCVFEARSKQT